MSPDSLYIIKASVLLVGEPVAQMLPFGINSGLYMAFVDTFARLLTK